MNEGQLFNACVQVLRSKWMPIHYCELTRLAVILLTGQEPAPDRLKKLKEDVRERLLAAGRLGTGYLPGKTAEGYLREWNDDGFLMPPNHALKIRVDHALEAGVEACVRFAFILNKQQSTEYVRAERIVRGFIIEKTVCDFFRNLWPENYLPAENDKKPEKPCSHDFRLVLPKKIVGVDVAGMSKRGEYFTSPTKPRTNIHLFAYIEEKQDCVILQGFKLRESMADINKVWQFLPIDRFIVAVNMLRAGRTIKELKP